MSANPIIRDAERRDLSAITAIYAEAVRNGTASYETVPPDLAGMTRRWQALAGGGYPYVVAEENGDILGFAYAGPYHGRPGYRFSVEGSVYIAPAAQRRGTGRALLTRVIETAEASGFRQMIAVIGGADSHAASVRLHEALGFRPIGVFKGSGYKFGRWLDTLLMQRTLGPGSGTPPRERSDTREPVSGRHD
jgi:phosphinothricin acetyltransferase